MIGAVKAYLKYLIAIAFFYSGLYRVLFSIKKRNKRPWPLVLMYHRVIVEHEKAGLQPGIYVTKNVFAKQVAFMSAKYNIMAMSQFALGINKGEHYSGSDLIITFDDGWRDNFSNAFPILKKHDVAATI
jgi:peptidoglycan/xylan/chitin deacetylase (PgdA/CDA1 family)